MAETHLDEIVRYPAVVITQISADKNCVGLLMDKNPEDVTEDDQDVASEKFIYDYQYIDDTATESTAYIWVETDVPQVKNYQIKDMTVYVTVSCHKRYMRLENTKFKGFMGNRRDNLVRYIDKLLNGTELMGIGKLTLSSARIITAPDGFTSRQLTYFIPDFNTKDLS